MTLRHHKKYRKKYHQRQLKSILGGIMITNPKHQTVYNKLVRDYIPEIIESSGKTYTHHIADEAEYQSALLTKLREEADEFISTPSVEELADILEVIDAIKQYYHYEDAVIHAVKTDKAIERGGFAKRIILETVETSH
jgi:predicted house-cleaning noncanonical NTP pyrophosphatase (MazG superfamily)